MILLANGKVITRDPDGIGYLPDGGVVTDGGNIVEVGTDRGSEGQVPPGGIRGRQGRRHHAGPDQRPHPHLLRPGPGPLHRRATTPPTSMRCWTASGGTSTGTWTLDGHPGQRPGHW